jgi:hypothetical protein
MVERAEQAIESAGELWVDALFLRRRRPSSWLRECPEADEYAHQREEQKSRIVTCTKPRASNVSMETANA